MPKQVQRLFAVDNKIIPYRFYNGIFQTRYRKNGYCIEVASKDFEEMKRKFLAKLETAEPKQRVEVIHTGLPPTAGTKITFRAYGEQWLKLKEKTTKESTMKEYTRTFNYNLKPTFGNMKLTEITRQMIQDYLFSFVDEGKLRTAEKLKLMLNCIFDMATEDFNIPSPVKKIVLPYHERKKGSAFTKQEERKLVNYCITNKDNAATSALLVLLYFGLRQSELKSIRIINEQFLECETSKERMGRNVVLRQIPFTPVLKKVLPYIDFEKAKNVNTNTVASCLKRLFPNHHPHELRYTFITRCKECGVNLEVVMLWDGHSTDKDVRSSAVDRGYTDYSSEYILQEAQKVDYTF